MDNFTSKEGEVSLCPKYLDILAKSEGLDFDDMKSSERVLTITRAEQYVKKHTDRQVNFSHLVEIMAKLDKEIFSKFQYLRFFEETNDFATEISKMLLKYLRDIRLRTIKNYKEDVEKMHKSLQGFDGQCESCEYKLECGLKQ